MQGDDSLLAFAALFISTFTPSLLTLLNWETYPIPRMMRNKIALSDPIIGHFMLPQMLEFDDEVVSSNSMLLEMKIVEFVSIFSSSKCCSLMLNL